VKSPGNQREPGGEFVGAFKHAEKMLLNGRFAQVKGVRFSVSLSLPGELTTEKTQNKGNAPEHYQNKKPLASTRK
jgi:hypothetical protein